MDPTDFEGSNLTLTAPDGKEDEVEPLRVLRHPGGMLSRWRVTEEDLEAIRQTGCVWLNVVGATHPAVWISPHIEFGLTDPDGKAH